jgi:hypothetical protein
MTNVKRLTVGLLLFIATLLAAFTGTYFLVDDATIVALLTKRLARASNTHITYRQDAAITRTLAPTLNINELLIQDNNKKFQVSTSSLHLQLSLPGLLSGKLDIPQLYLGDTRVQITANGAGGKLNVPDSLPLRPILHDVSISRISLDSAESKYTLPPIHVKELTLGPDLGADTIISTVQTEVGGRNILINLEIPGVDKIMKSRIVPFSIAAKGPAADLSVKGQVDFNQSSPEVEASIQGTVADLKKFSTGVEGFQFPGELTGQSRVKGSFSQLAMEDLSVTWKGPDQSTAKLSGHIDNIIDLTGFALNVDGQLDKPTWLTPLVADSTGGIKSAELSAQIDGAWKQLGMRAFKLKMKTEEALDLSLNGQFDLVHTQAGTSTDNLELKLAFAAPTTHAARSLLFKDVWEFGAITGKGDIRSSGPGDPAVENIVVQARTENSIEVDLRGSIAHFPLAPDRPNTGYDLDVNMKAVETKVMAAVFGTHLPLEGPLAITYRIEGDTKALQLNEINLSAGEENGVHLDIKGQLLFGDWGQADPLQSVDLHILGNSNDTKSLGAAIEKRLPELGSLSGQAHLHTVSGKHRIDDFTIRLGESAAPAVTATGSINHLFSAGNIDLDVKLNLDGKSFAPFADMPDMVALTGDMLISNSDGSLGINRLDITSSGTKLLSLEIKGEFDDFKDTGTLEFNVRLTARDLQLIGSLFELEWPAIGPVTLNSQIKQEGSSTAFDTTLTAGKALLDAKISSSLQTSPPHINGKITAQEFFFFDPLEKKIESSKEKPPKNGPVFSRTPMDWAWLKKNDLDLSVIIESFGKEHPQFKSAQFEIALKSGHLSISPAELVYPKGKLEFDVKLDVQDQPQFSLKVFGEDINPRQLLDMAQVGENDAELDIDMKLMSSGASAHELAANLEGNLYVLVNNGRIKSDILKMIFVDVVGWSFDKATGKKYTEIECGVADYSVKQGIIDTTALYLDTPDIAVVGKGTVDLANETIDYTFLPRKKTNLVHLASPVNVKGSLDDPSVSVIPLKSAAIKYGSLFFAPYLFVGMYAADLMTDALKIGSFKSPCMEYKKKHRQDLEMSSPKPKPESPAPD